VGIGKRDGQPRSQVVVRKAGKAQRQKGTGGRAGGGVDIRTVRR